MVNPTYNDGKSDSFHLIEEGRFSNAYDTFRKAETMKKADNPKLYSTKYIHPSIAGYMIHERAL